MLVLALAAASVPAADPPPPEDEINVVGLSSGKAVIQFNKPSSKSATGAQGGKGA